MGILGRLLESILREELASADDVASAIRGRERVVATYTGEDGSHEGARLIEVYAYGLTSAGNPAVRVFQPYGDTASRVPAWKLMRLDRITSWEPTGQTFDEPPEKRYAGVPPYNPNGDRSMAAVYLSVRFDDDGIYRTDAERASARLLNQVSNPVTADGLRNAGGGAAKSAKPAETPVYRTAAETGLEKLRAQPGNPRKIDLPGASQPLTTTQPAAQTPAEPPVYRTATETGMEKLRAQLDNPQKIDLSKIPGR